MKAACIYGNREFVYEDLDCGSILHETSSI